jgi:hypothetical protein
LEDKQREDIAKDPKVAETAIFQVSFNAVPDFFEASTCKYALETQ